jgi:4-amino-4-deoxy-L-arabinose transferase-like glycosyltransferase
MIKFKSNPVWFFILALVISVPAYMIFLGHQPFIDDESIRALVAFEMLQTGDFITPTVGGEIYLKKPPLFNWLVALSFNAFNSYDELPVRIPMILSLYLYTLAIFYYFRKEFTTELAVVSALMFLTCGRIIIYESLYGLIDLTFSFLTFLFFMLIYKAFNEGRLLKLFLIAYVLTAFSFLLKGLPSIVFLGITLLVLFISQRKFKLLFSWQHYVSILIFGIIVGAYYYLYFTQNHVAPEDMLSVMFGETTRRTALRFGIWNTLLHFVAFPFEMIYHFLPWTLFTIALFTRGTIKKIKSNPFLTYLSLVFIFNIIVYWTSPEVYPRYILMLMPLYFGVTGFFFLELKKDNHAFVRSIEIILGVVLTIASISTLIPVFKPLPAVTHPIWIATFLFLSTGVVTLLFWRQINNRIYWLAIAILIFRIGFDLIVIPVRVSESGAAEGKKTAITIAKETSDAPLFFWWNPKQTADGYYGKRLTTYWFMYYLSSTRDEIIYTTSDRRKDAYYITPGWNVEGENIKIIKEFQPAGHESTLILFRFQ